MNLDRIRSFYRRTHPVRLLRPDDGLGDPLQIVTIRHGKPLVERRRRYSATEARQYTIDYDAAGVEPIDRPILDLEEGEIDRIYTSTLPRAYLTAEALFGDRFPVERHAFFIELERRMPGWPNNLRLSLRYWQLINRVQYFGGRRYGDIEAFRQARLRIRQAATFLEEAAQKEGAAVLVAHGLFNFFLALTLRHRGWRRVRLPGRQHLGVGVLVKERRGDSR